MLHRLSSAIVLTGVILASGCSVGERPTLDRLSDTEIAGLRDRIIEVYSQSPDATRPTESNAYDPTLQRLLDDYHEAVIMAPANHRQLKLSVVDESGRPLNGVNMVMKRIWFNHIWDTEPSGNVVPLTIDREFETSWNWPDSVLEFAFSKAGYRSIRASFAPSPSVNDANHYSGIFQIVQTGYILPPMIHDGPVRIMMPPALVWDPPSGPSADDSHSAPNISQYPASMPSNSVALIDSDDPRYILAPARGTYAVVDRNGKIQVMIQLDRGNLCGFSPDVNKGSSFTFGGSGLPLDATLGPYTFRLYSKPARENAKGVTTHY